MKLVTIHAPRGDGQKVAGLAMEAEISEVAVSEATLFSKKNSSSPIDIVHIQSSTSKVKDFIESLMSSSFYDPSKIAFTIKHPESIFGTELPEEESQPTIRPTTDVYEELWQFTQITFSLVGRVFLSAFLIAYGMREGFIPLIIAGLLFLPYHHHLIALGLGAVLKEWRFFQQALKSFFLTTLLIVSGGVAMALFSEPGIKWSAFSETSVMFSFLISMAIGIAAGLAAVDDAGRRELIGLAATAHLSVYPVWFGLKIIYGFEPSDEPWHFLGVFLMDFLTITLSAAVTFIFVRMNGNGILRFIEEKKRRR